MTPLPGAASVRTPPERPAAVDRVPGVGATLFAAGPNEQRKRAYEHAAHVALFLMAASLLIPLVGLFGYLVFKAWPLLSWSLILENPRHYMRAGGLWAPLVGTFYSVLLSLMIATPIGVLAGVYLHEYAREGALTRLINLAVLNLAGVPSIVHALFGVEMFVLGAGFGRSVLAASCTLAVMTLPAIIASTTGALAAVPRPFREACWILGLSRWQTVRTIVLPNAIGGILTGVILQVSRAAGETAPILFTGAVFYVSVPDGGVGSFVPYGWRDPFMALSYHLFTVTTQVTGVSDALPYATALVLIGLVVCVNATAIVLRLRLRAARRW